MEVLLIFVLLFGLPYVFDYLIQNYKKEKYKQETIDMIKEIEFLEKKLEDDTISQEEFKKIFLKKINLETEIIIRLNLDNSIENDLAARRKK